MLVRNLPAFLIVATVLAAPVSASADTIGPWSLNTTYCGGPPMPTCTGGPWGSVSLSDNVDPQRVDVTVTLNDPAVIRDVWLNFESSFFDLAGDLTFTMLAYIGAAAPFTVNADLDGRMADGYQGDYDLNVPFQGNTPVTSLMFTLCSGVDPPGNPDTNPSFCNDSVDLNVAHFNLQDEFGLTHVAVLRNSAGGGSVPNFLTDTTSAPVPEPGSLLLFGTGLAVAARRFRRRT
jgi:hypothetical protein